MRRLRRNFDEEQEEHTDESWLIPYADILTLLLALFIVLFASSNINQAKYEAIMKSFKSEFTGTKIDTKSAGLSPIPSSTEKQEPAQSVHPSDQKNDPELDQLKQKLEQYIAVNHLEAVTTLIDSRRGIEIAFKDVVLFDPGKADLKESSFLTLDKLIGLIATLPNSISIEGHTDNVPIGNAAFASNWELSAARAASVLHFFESKDIAQNRLQFSGFGEFQPLYPNDSTEHRQANRRVNIVILRSNN
ncbi:MAG TPA: flagellar motor protein MotB [Neobacillus sp.]|jgi:chemotaxis protein MotB